MSGLLTKLHSSTVMSKNLFRPALCFALLTVVGCGKDAPPHPDGTHPHADGTVHEGHHDGEPAANDHAAELEERGAVDLGTITLGGATLALDATGPATPGTSVTLNVRITAGTMPETIRIWYGVESGIGSMKAKGTPHDDHFHADVEVPEPAMENAALWLEAVASDGTKKTGSVSF